jgi:hypothetical protein
LTGDQRASQKIDAALEGAEIAAGAWIGVRLIAVVDRLGEKAAPDGGRKQRTRRKRRPRLPGRKRSPGFLVGRSTDEVSGAAATAQPFGS